MSTGAPHPVPAASGANPNASRLGRVLLGLSLLFAVPLFLRLWPIEHGAPTPEYVADTHVVRNALGMLADKDPIPPVGKYSTYPYLLAYTLVPVFAADYAVGRATGAWSSAQEYGDLLRVEPWHAHRLARITFAILASLAPLFVFLTARAAGLGVGAWIAAWLAATCLLHVHMSLHERPWAPMATAMAAVGWLAALHARDGKRWTLVAAGVVAGLAMGMHQGGGAALLMCGLAWLVAPTRDGEPGTSFTALGRKVPLGFLVVGLCLVVYLCLGSPYSLRYGATPAEAVAGHGLEEGRTTVSIGGQQLVLDFSLHAAWLQTRALFAHDPVILILGLLGLGTALRRRTLVPVLGFALTWAVIFFVNPNQHVRYVLPVALLLSLPAGLFVERFARSRSTRIAAVLVLALPAVQALRLGAVMRGEDTRVLATERLDATLDADARVAIDVYGPIIAPTAEALRTTARLRHLYGREAFRLGALESGTPAVPPGRWNVRLQDVLEIDASKGESWVRAPRSSDVDLAPPLDLGDTPRSALEALGATHVLIVDRWPGDGVPPALLDRSPGTDPEKRKLEPLELGPPLWTITPGDPGRDGTLPATLDFPLLDLWAVERPGPALSLYAL